MMQRMFHHRLGRRWAIELTLFAALACAATWPLLSNITRSLPLGAEPCATVPLLNAWTLWWNADRCLHGYRGYWDSPIFHPARDSFAFSEPSPTTVIAAPVVWLTGSRVLAYNLLLLSALALNGWTASRLLGHWGIGWAASLAGGAIVELLPLVHHELGVAQLVPLCGIIGTCHALTAFGDRPRSAWALAAGGAFGLTYLHCGYYGLFFSVLLVPAAPWLLGRRLWEPRSWPRLIPGAVLAVALIAPAAAVQHRVAREHRLARSSDSLQRLSAKPADYLTQPWPSLWDRLRGSSPRTENAFPLWPGSLTCLLAALGAAGGLARRRTRRFAGCALTLLAAGWLLSLGPGFRLAGWSPYNVLIDGIPGFAQARNVFRFAVFAQLAVALLAGLGLGFLDRRLRDAGRGLALARFPRWAVLPLGMMSACELFPPLQPLRFVPPLACQQDWIGWLDEHTDADTAIVCVPFAAGIRAVDYEETGFWMYWGTFHQRRLVNGYSGFFPETHTKLKAAMRGFPDRASLDLLRQYGVEYCIVRTSAEMPPGMAIPPRALSLVFRDQAAGVDVYRLCGTGA